MTAFDSNRLRARFGRLGPGSGARGLVRGFLAWWAQALVSWLPLRVRRALGMDRGRLLLQVDGDAVQLRLQLGSEVRDLAHLPGLAEGAVAAIAAPEFGPPVADPLAPVLGASIADLPRWLLLPASISLRRRMLLPAAAADRLHDVVGFEIDRQTPFSADAVAFDARVLGQRDSDGQLDVELVAVPLGSLNPQMAALGPLASTLSGIDVAAPDGIPLGINLMPPAQRSRRGDPWRSWNAALAAVALVAIGATLWQLLDNRREAADAFEQAIARRAEPARRAAAQRQQLQTLIDGQVFLDRARAMRPTAVEIIDEVSRRMPDGTYLEKLTIEDERLTLMGLSNEAAALVGRLQDSALWRLPALAGALQPDPASGRDRFTLTAELAPAVPAATPRKPEAQVDAAR
jgi:general secretion pathway protein L